jgi:hypothetical protein
LEAARGVTILPRLCEFSEYQRARDKGCLLRCPTFLNQTRKNQRIREYHTGCNRFAAQKFRKTLGWMDVDVSSIDKIWKRLYCDETEPNPPAELVYTFAKIIGSYVGEGISPQSWPT